MAHRSIKKTSILLVASLLLGCKAYHRKTPVFFSTGNKAEIRINTSCRNSSLLPLPNEAELKSKMLQYSKESMTRLKLKTSPDTASVTYRITKTMLTITEKCGDKNTGGKPQISLQEVITLEHALTKELLQFQSDTIIPFSSSLSKPAPTVSKKTELDPYINGITNDTYRKMKKHFCIK